MLPVITFATAISQSFSRMFISGAIARPPGAESGQRSMVRAAYKRFDKECSNSEVGLLKLDFLEEYGEDTIQDYLNHRLTRHEAAVNLARIWESAWIPATADVSKQLRADVVMAADTFLAYLAPAA